MDTYQLVGNRFSIFILILKWQLRFSVGFGQHPGGAQASAPVARLNQGGKLQHAFKVPDRKVEKTHRWSAGISLKTSEMES